MTTLFSSRCCRFCCLCLEGRFHKETTECKCPDAAEPSQRHNVFRDKFAQKELLALECFCSNKARRCQWRGPLAKLQNHSDAECPFSEVKCLNSHLGCDVVITKYHLAEHLKNECLNKAISCPYCQVEFDRAKMTKHLEECGKFPVKCPYGCDKSETGLKEKLPEHSKTCPQALFRCSCSSMGCDFHGPKESLVERPSSHTAEHLTLLGTYTEDNLERVNLELNQAYEAQLSMQNQYPRRARVSQTLSMHQLKLARLEENLNTQRKRFDELCKSVEAMINSKEGENARQNIPEVLRRLDFQGKMLTLLADEVKRLNRGRHPSRGQTQTCEQVSMPYVNDNDDWVDLGERNLTLHEFQLCDQDLKLQNLETASCDGSFLWKIDEFCRRFRESVEGEVVSIDSPPFYTERYGYKLCLRSFLSGDGLMGNEKYMSLFIVVMRGEYDALLPWPFQQKITFKLLDQERNSHVTETFRPDPNSPSFQRPRSEMNVASGCPTFCSLHLLRSRGYVRGDTVFVKIMWAALSR